MAWFSKSRRAGAFGAGLTRARRRRAPPDARNCTAPVDDAFKEDEERNFRVPGIVPGVIGTDGSIVTAVSQIGVAETTPGGFQREKVIGAVALRTEKEGN